MARAIRFGDLTRTELQAYVDRQATVLVPVGATEQHGPHLPVDTDTYLAERFALSCAGRFDDVLVAPAVPWGMSAGHRELGATIAVHPATYLELLMDISRSLIESGFPNQVWVNGHNGNKALLGVLVYEAQRRWNTGIAAVSYFDFAGPHLQGICATGDFHAGEVETSLVQALDAERVHEAPPGTGRLPEGLTSYDTVDLSRPGPAFVGGSFVARFPDGVAGDPSQATPDKGRRIADVSLEGLTRFVGEYIAYRRRERGDG